MPFGYSVYPWSEVGTVFLTLKYFVFPLTPYIYLLSNHISYASVSPLPLGEGIVSCHCELLDGQPWQPARNDIFSKITRPPQPRPEPQPVPLLPPHHLLYRGRRL